jgi:hypothetical protein
VSRLQGEQREDEESKETKERTMRKGNERRSKPEKHQWQL